MSKKACSKCDAGFECGHEQRGCWCERYSIDKGTLGILKEEYSNCLCPECLKGYAALIFSEETK